jgi:phospholipase C
MAPITLFEIVNFGGQAVGVDEGSTRFSTPAQLKDFASSIRVAPGHCAVLYEHANEFGGYGLSVDLLEDCPSLSAYGFDKKLSFIRVFRTERDGYLYARGRMSDGTYVPGHWERKRAGGSPARDAATVAVVGPALPPPTTQAPDGIEIHDHRRDRSSNIKHLFVLMLENRSFDHMLGHSGITGTDAQTGTPTTVDGLNGTESNSYNGRAYAVSRGAPDRAPYDPGHGFSAVLEQLCGEGVRYESGSPYPPINNSGFASHYARSHPNTPDGAMQCFTPEQVPVITALAREFVVCDRWFCSMPGPTEPNRWFVHAGTAGDHDKNLTHREYAELLNPWGGVEFANGSIFKLLKNARVKYRIYACDEFPNVALLDGVSRTFDIDDFDDFAEDVASGSYDAAYTFIEPSYDAFRDYKNGNSQHPLGSAKAGELLIKRTYEALRKSPIWGSSMLLVTYDEHGGFYDHVAPPSARATGSKGRATGFTFDQLGPRVPAVIACPLVTKNLIDHRVYEHSSVIATLLNLFSLGSLTPRTSTSSDFKHLVTLDVGRADAPMTLPDPMAGVMARSIKLTIADTTAETPGAPLQDDPSGLILDAVASGLAQHLEVAPEAEHSAIRERVKSLKTHGDALAYLKEVAALVKKARAKAGVRRSATVRQLAGAIQ